MMSAKTDIPNTSSTSPSPSPTTANSTVTTITTSSPISESKPRRLPTSETYHYNVQHHLQHYENNNRFSTRQNLQQLKEQATSQNNNNNNNNNTSTSTPMSYNSTPSTTITKTNLDPVSSFPLSVPTTPTTLTTNTTTIINDNTKDKDNHNIDKEEDDIQQKLLLKEQSLNDIKLQCSRLIYELEGNNEPELIIKKYIQDLNKYNELKDLALQLITLIADQRKVKTSDILQEMNIEINNNE